MTVTELLKSIFERNWGKYSSLLVFYPLCILGTLGFIDLDGKPLQTKDIIIICTIVFLLLSYTIYVVNKNRLPRAKMMNRSVLFIIDSENEQLFNDIKKKLISEFYSNINTDGKTIFYAKYISIERLHNLNLEKKEDAVYLLTKTNCAFFIRVWYCADSTTQIENYSMHINCGVVHPQLNEHAQRLLQHALDAFTSPIRKTKFHKAQLFDHFEFTAQHLSMMTIYIIGLVEVFSDNTDDAYILFKKLLKEQSDKTGEEKGNLKKAIQNWLFICCIENNRHYITLFQLEKDLSFLEKANMYLEEANTIHPSTYEYFLNKAYYFIAAKRDVTNAVKCVGECRKLNTSQSWKYSDAFLAAYQEFSANTIITKYKSAFKVNENLVNIVDYIEYIIEKDVDKVALHLAAALLYSRISDDVLETEHIKLYYAKEQNPRNKETVRRYFNTIL